MGAAGMAAMRSGEVAVLSVTVREIARKVSLGRLPPVGPDDGDLAGWLRDEGYALVALDAEDAEAATRLPPHHADPRDRFLIAAALRRGWPVITSDRSFPSLRVRGGVVTAAFRTSRR